MFLALLSKSTEKRYMDKKLEKLWVTKDKNDEWWSSFVTSPLAIFANWIVVDWKWLTPNLITFFSLITALLSTALIIIGGQVNFYIAAGLINVSHILDCMDGQMARYRETSSRLGNYFDKITDFIQIFFWFGAIAYAAFLQTHSIIPIFLAFTGVSFYSLRVYVKYVTIFIEVEYDNTYLEKYSHEAAIIDKRKEQIAGHRTAWKKNLCWLLGEQRKFFLFNEAVFIFILSFALITNMIMPMLWLFAISQLYYGIARSWQRGQQIHHNQHKELLKSMEK